MLKAVFRKRTVSLLLCMALMLSFMPTTSSVDLAEPEETAPAQESDLPEAIPALDGEDMEPADPQAFPLQPDVEPQEIPAGGVSGTCGNNLTWTLTEDGTLTISGTGDMVHYSSTFPWHPYYLDINFVVISSGVTSIEKQAFHGSRYLTSVAIPDSVTSIGDSAFYGCSLKRITIPDSVTNIGDSAFGYCDFESIIIPNGVTRIGDYMFFSCSSLNSITIPNSVTSIGDSAFSYCTSLSSIMIPNSVTNIGLGAFYGCSKLINVSIPLGVTNIRNDTFYGCRTLISITIPNSITRIGNNAFYGCKSLTSIAIPSSVTSIGDSAFDGCSSLTRVDITDIDAWCRITFSDYNANPLNRARYLYLNNKLVTNVVIPADVTELAYIFSGCSSLTSVTIPNSVASIGESTFSGCSALTSVTIPDSVTSIGNGAFSGCSSLTSVTVPDSVTQISNSAFNWCSSLTEVTIGAGMQIIAQNAFYNCSNLTNVYYRGTPDAWEEVLIETGNDSLKNANLHILGLSITQQPTSVQVTNVGDTASTTVAVHGDGLSYQWYIKNPGAAKFTKSSITKATYSTKVTEASNGRQLYCVIMDQYGNSVQSDTVTFSVRGTVVITGQPVSVQVEKAGDTASTTVTAIGEGLTYQWYIKNTTDTAFKASAIKKATYSTTVREACSGRQLYCVVKDKYGNTAQTDTVTFTIKPSVKIVTQPKSVVVSKIGDTATATVTAQGEGLTYQWYIKNPADAEFKASAIKKATYSTQVTEASDGRELYCVVKDKHGNSVQTNTITFSVARVKIVTQPGNAVVEKIGDRVQTKVTATGEGLIYQWYLKNPGENGFKASSIRKATYSTTLTAAANGRELYCVVTDKYGNTAQTETVTLTALPAGLLTLRLLPETVTAQNGAASFSISAMGDGVTYAWYYKDAGQVNFYRDACTSAACAMTVTAANDGRQVFCVITDANGNRVRSNTCTVNV